MNKDFVFAICRYLSQDRKRLRVPFLLALLFVAIFATPFCKASDEKLPRILRTNRVWNAAHHNAFTDLVRFNDAFFLVFREADRHGVPRVGSPGGKLRILTSIDGIKWESVALLEGKKNEDLRDGKLSTTPDGQLMLIAAAANQESIDERQSLVWFSVDGKQWTTPRNIGEKNRWMWAATWQDQTLYGVGYGPSNTPRDKPRTSRLYRSEDGKRFEPIVSSLTDTAACEDAGETALMFRSDGSAVALVRRDREDQSALVGTSRGDYTKWGWHKAGVRIGGPELIELPDNRIVAASRRHDQNDRRRTSLQWLDPTTGTLTEFLVLPSGGDTSYTGMVWHDDRLWISYYSSHEEKTSIYVSEVVFPDISKKT